jgi:hypothetical protein
MKNLIISLISIAAMQALAGNVSVEAVHPAVSVVQDTLTKSMEIIDIKSTAVRATAACNLVKQRLGALSIGSELLGKFKNLKRDKVGVAQFKKLLPSILVTKVLPQLDRAEGAAFVVSPAVTDRGGNVTEVSASIGGYIVTFLLYGKGGTYKSIDALGFGYSAVATATKSIQDQLTAEYNKDPHNSKPVTALVNSYLADPTFVHCR